jgi:predicted outer membrane repeat protein
VYCGPLCILACTRCAFIGNTASDRGGAVYASASKALAFTDSTFEGNSAANDGGALYIVEPSQGEPVAFDRCLLLSNTAGGSGGGLVCAGCKRFQATNTIFALNAASGSTGGGGVRIEWTANVNTAALLAVVGTTFVGNTAAGGGAAGLSVDVTGANLPLTVTNSIFSGPLPLIQWLSPADLTISYSVWPDQPAPCSVCGSGIITLDPLLVRGAAALPAGTVGPAAWWAPAVASPGNKMGFKSAFIGIKDYLGNERVSECVDAVC